MTTTLRPKYISFDCYGTLINFQMKEKMEELFADRVSPENMKQFTTDFARYRLDEVMGDFRPYGEILCNSVERTCRRWGVAYRDNEGLEFYEAVKTWNPHPDVPDALAKLAKEYKLVILSNSMNDLIPHSIPKLGAPFYRVYTAEQASSYATPYGILPSYELVNLNLNWLSVSQGPVDLGVFVTNLFNEKYLTTTAGIYDAAGFEALFLGEPRMYGARVRVSFGG